MTRILEGCLGIYRKLDTRAASWLLGNSYPWVEGWYHGIFLYFHSMPLLPAFPALAATALKCRAPLLPGLLHLEVPQPRLPLPPWGSLPPIVPPNLSQGELPTLGLGSRPSPCSAAPLLCPREGLDRPIMSARSCLPFPSLSLGPFSLQLYPTVGSFWNILRRS